MTRFSAAAYPHLAAIGRVPGIDLSPSAPSIFRFGAQNRDEPAPAGVTDTSIQPGLRPGTIGQILAGVVGIGTGLTRRSMLAICKSSTTSRS